MFGNVIGTRRYSRILSKKTLKTLLVNASNLHHEYIYIFDKKTSNRKSKTNSSFSSLYNEKKEKKR